jgi:hypothetical protein
MGFGPSASRWSSAWSAKQRSQRRRLRPQLRPALYEAAQSAGRPTSPDRAGYLALKKRGLTHTRASITIARKFARCFHTLRELGPAALESVPESWSTAIASAKPAESQMAATTLLASSSSDCDSRPGRRSNKDRVAGAVPNGRPIDHHVAGGSEEGNARPEDDEGGTQPTDSRNAARASRRRLSASVL